MSYEVYKVMHLVSLVIYVASLGAGFFSDTRTKLLNIISMTSGLLILVAGMGLLARLYPGQPWPMWAVVKMVLWIGIIGAAASLIKRLKTNRAQAFSGLVGALLVAVILAVLKPF